MTVLYRCISERNTQIYPLCGDRKKIKPIWKQLLQYCRSVRLNPCGASVRAGVAPAPELAWGSGEAVPRSTDRWAGAGQQAQPLPAWHQTGPVEAVALQSAKAQRWWPGWQHPARLCSLLPWCHPAPGLTHEWWKSTNEASHTFPEAAAPGWEPAVTPLVLLLLWPAGESALGSACISWRGLSSATLPHQHGTPTKHRAAWHCQPLSDKNQRASAPRRGADGSGISLHFYQVFVDSLIVCDRSGYKRVFFPKGIPC